MFLRLWEIARLLPQPLHLISGLLGATSPHTTECELQVKPSSVKPDGSTHPILCRRDINIVFPKLPRYHKYSNKQMVLEEVPSIEVA